MTSRLLITFLTVSNRDSIRTAAILEHPGSPSALSVLNTVLEISTEHSNDFHTTERSYRTWIGLMGRTRAGHRHRPPIPGQTMTDTKHDIVDTAVAAGSFTTLVAAVGAAGLADTLKGEGPFTVFAPTDAAFAALPAGTRPARRSPCGRCNGQGARSRHRGRRDGACRRHGRRHGQRRPRRDRRHHMHQWRDSRDRHSAAANRLIRSYNRYRGFPPRYH
jgi:uncharacterized surface protein with fasciclin (FAS1) repeats